jgi:uncharacterized cysteine cluster protein YcgN (CxxCxxCC family)
MSGGSYDYVCHKIADITIEKTRDNKKRLLFQKLLKLVAEAMHDIEWVDSCDYGEGDENKALDAVFDFLKGNAETKWKALAYDEIVSVIKSNEAGVKKGEANG